MSIYCYDCKKVKETPKCGYCRECQKKRNIAYRSNKDKVVKPRTGLCACGAPFAPYSKTYCLECSRRKNNEYIKSHPEQRKETQKKADIKRRGNPKDKFKYHARQMVLQALRYGELEKQPCEVCSTTENVEAHHDDYRKPLEVVWLCIRHHDERHNEMKLKGD
jgi:hypothetical protein